MCGTGQTRYVPQHRPKLLWHSRLAFERLQKVKRKKKKEK
jgi:hypothetical protein